MATLFFLNPYRCVVTKSVRCEGVEIEALIDTGAGISVVSPNFAEKIEARVTNWEGLIIRMANGTPVTPAGKTKITIEENGKKIKGEVVVLELGGNIDLL